MLATHFRGYLQGVFVRIGIHLLSSAETSTTCWTLSSYVLSYLQEGCHTPETTTRCSSSTLDASHLKFRTCFLPASKVLMCALPMLIRSHVVIFASLTSIINTSLALFPYFSSTARSRKPLTIFTCGQCTSSHQGYKE